MPVRARLKILAMVKVYGAMSSCLSRYESAILPRWVWHWPSQACVVFYAPRGPATSLRRPLSGFQAEAGHETGSAKRQDPLRAYRLLTPRPH